MRRRHTLATTALTFVLGLTLVACTSDASPGESTPSTGTATAGALTPEVELLVHSGDALLTTPYFAVFISPEFRTTFDTDMVSRLSRQASAERGSARAGAESRIIGNDLWFTLQTDKWTHLDLRKLRPESSTAYGMHLIVVEALLPGVVTATLTSPHSYEGTIDLRQAVAATDTPAVKRSQQSMLQTFETPILPFEASTDEQGRLTSLVFTQDFGDGQGPTKNSITISYATSAVTVEPPPAALVTEATAETYATY